MNRKIPRVLALHDLSGFGRCALTVVIPVMSSYGIQVCPVPTAALSTHTGGFNGFSFLDLTGFMKDTLAHYQKLQLRFEGIYSGFLGSPEQCGLVEEYIAAFGEGVVLVDPVLGDNGALYSTVTQPLVVQMRKLISRADVITPNMTEGAYLLEESAAEALSQGQALDWAKRLCELGPGCCVLTGVRIKGREGKVFSVLYDKNDGTSCLYGSSEVYGEYPGAGDAFASVLLSGLLTGKSREESLRQASDFVYRSIALARKQGTPFREGLPIEEMIKKEMKS